MHGSMVEFRADGAPVGDAHGGTAAGYLSLPPGGRGPGLLVLQEWWGLVDHIKQVADRFAAAGFVALAPDLYRGEKTTHPDDAQRLLMALDMADTAKMLRGAAAYLLAHEAVTPKKVGAVGFCMGGQLALFAGAENPTIGATVDFYGIHPHVTVDVAKLSGPVLAFFAEHDDYVGAAAMIGLAQRMADAGKRLEVHRYLDAHHAFMNDTRPEVYHPAHAEAAWARTVAFLHQHLADQR